MASLTAVRQRKQGGEFLIAPAAPEEIFTPEDFTDEHKAVAKTTEDFYWNEVAPHAEAMLKQPVAAVSILRKAAELGLTGVAVPERYGGMEMDLISAMIVAEHLSKNGSYGVWHSAHSGIGTMPLLLFGNEEQKQKYLPRLVSGEMVAAYALTEPHAGSDVQAIKTRAELDAAGRNYLLNGQKMWISNAAGAGLFTVFAKVDGEKFTAFLIERSSEGLAIGAEEKKMGIKGSSTCAVYFDNVGVPVENVLGEVGGGLRIAFNCLNLGRLKLGAGVLGAAKHALAVTLKYAKERHAFGKPIAEFGLMRQKLAEMAVRIFAAETMTYRVAGAIDDWLRDVSWDQPEAPALHLKAFEEFAAECAMVKVFTTETLDYVVDEGVQIHGGYGFHQDYEIECAYRDSRINRIFEGTNEINRMLVTGMLLKRAQRGRLALPEAVKALEAELLNPPPAAATGDPLALAAGAKQAALLALGVAFRRFHTDLDKQQEVLAGIADIAAEALAIESLALRVGRLENASHAAEMCRVFAQDAIARVEAAGRAVLAACSEGDALRVNLAILKRLARCEPVDGFAARRRIAGRLLEAERYVVSS
jgi:alkylation response protein AidB-like acyl-CoA dehydrogenase